MYFICTVEFTAAAVWSSYKLFIAPMMTDRLQKIAMTIGDEQPRECDLFVSGGGAKNNAIMRYCKQYADFNQFRTSWLYCTIPFATVG